MSAGARESTGVFGVSWPILKRNTISLTVRPTNRTSGGTFALDAAKNVNLFVHLKVVNIVIRQRDRRRIRDVPMVKTTRTTSTDIATQSDVKYSTT